MIELIASPDPAFPADWRAVAYRLHDKRLGTLLGIGRDPLRCAALRLSEEGEMAGTTFKVIFGGGRRDPEFGVVALPEHYRASPAGLADMPADYLEFLELKAPGLLAEAIHSASEPSAVSESPRAPNPPYGA